jgi:predicted negative regulator of RcsB-dependent stress response
VARITRKELKSDKFAQEVGLTVTFFEEHRKDVIRYGGIGLAAIILIGSFLIYQRHQVTARQEALGAAIAIQESPVGPAATGSHAFPSQEAKDAAAIQAFAGLAAKYSGSNEGAIAEYYLGSIAADQGKMAEAEKHFLVVMDRANANYASLAKLALADMYYSDGRNAQGEKTLRDLMAHPTIFVSADTATINLARHLATTNPAEARKLLAPLKDGKGAAAGVAQLLYSELPPQ